MRESSKLSVARRLSYVQAFNVRSVRCEIFSPFLVIHGFHVLLPLPRCRSEIPFGCERQVMAKDSQFCAPRTHDEPLLMAGRRATEHNTELDERRRREGLTPFCVPCNAIKMQSLHISFIMAFLKSLSVHFRVTRRVPNFDESATNDISSLNKLHRRAKAVHLRDKKCGVSLIPFRDDGNKEERVPRSVIH